MPVEKLVGVWKTLDLACLGQRDSETISLDEFVMIIIYDIYMNRLSGLDIVNVNKKANVLFVNKQFLKVSKSCPPALNGRFAKRGTTTIGG